MFEGVMSPTIILFSGSMCVDEKGYTEVAECMMTHNQYAETGTARINHAMNHSEEAI